jgi:ABC-2 type transport system permease protein
VRPLFARAGVDYGQWKAVTRTLLRSDFRPPGTQSTKSYSLQTVSGLLLTALVYGLFGAGAALVTFVNPDVLLTGTLTLTYLAMLLATALLTQHAATIVSTTDYAILAPRPVSSRTFLAVRLTNVLFHAMVLATLMGWPAMLAQTFAHGVNIARGLAAAAALYGFAMASAAVVVASYSTVLRFVGPVRLQRLLGYVQITVGLLAYLAVIFMMQVVRDSTLASATMPRGMWLLLVPPAWFASYLEIASGIGTPDVWLRAALSVAFLLAVFFWLRGPLAADYGDRLGELAAVTSAPSAAPSTRRALLFTRDETRAVALLVRAQFRYDMRVRLGILSIVPLTLLYMYIGAQDGGTSDPFVGVPSSRQFDLMSYAVLLFPSILVQQLAGSDAYRAAWIYFATPADRAALVVATKNVVVMFFLVPYAFFLVAALSWRFGHLGHAFVHTGFLAMLGLLVLQSAVLVSPRLPFATPPAKATGNAVMIIWMMVMMVASIIALVVVQRWVYRSWPRVAIVAALLLIAAALLDLLLRSRAVSRRHETFEVG